MATFEELMAKSRELNAAGDIEGAKRVAGIAVKQKRAIVNNKGLTGIMGGVEQFGAGLNEGIANFAGTPVDIMTGALNLGSAGINAALGTEIPAITDPVGGSGMTTAAMAPFISDRAPNGMVERYLRRGGQELGFGVPAALTGASFSKFGAPAREAMMPYLATSAAGDVGAAVAGQTSREIAPDNATADFIASLIGGGSTAALASRATNPTAPVPTLDELKAKANTDWQKVKAAPETLTDTATAGLEGAVRSALPTSQLAEEAYPKAFGMADKMKGLQNPTIYDAVEARRMIGDRVAADPAEAAVGSAMKKNVVDYLSGLSPADLRGGNPDEILDAFIAANKTTHQVKKAEAVINKEMRGETRAATTGTGGNEVNATRQNIRAIFDKERDPTLRGKKQGYTPDEMAAMEEVVKGSKASNAARLLGRMAPTSGAFPMLTTGWGGMAGVAAGMASGNPLLALPAVAGGVGFAGKGAAEALTKGQIEKLLKAILNGGKAPGMSAARAGSNRAVIEQLLSGAANGQPQ